MTTRDAPSGAVHEFISVNVAGQMCGLPVLTVRDILGPQRMTRIPLARAEIAGALNLRGRIVTAVDLRRRLGLAARGAGRQHMNVVVDHRGELYSLVVDQVGEVLRLEDGAFEPNPPTLDRQWRELCRGVYRLESGLLAVLDVARLIDGDTAAAA